MGVPYVLRGSFWHQYLTLIFSKTYRYNQFGSNKYRTSPMNFAYSDLVRHVNSFFLKKTLNFLFWWFKKENLMCQKYICIFSLLLLATTVLHCITLVTTVLHCITQFNTVLHCSPLRITDDYCITLLTTVFHWITLLNSKDHWWPVRIFVDYFITLFLFQCQVVFYIII